MYIFFCWSGRWKKWSGRWDLIFFSQDSPNFQPGSAHFPTFCVVTNPKMTVQPHQISQNRLETPCGRRTDPYQVVPAPYLPLCTRFSPPATLPERSGLPLTHGDPLFGDLGKVVCRPPKSGKLPLLVFFAREELIKKIRRPVNVKHWDACTRQVSG